MTTQIPRIPILAPLVIGTCFVAVTIAIHALALFATIRLFRYEKRTGRAGENSWRDFAIVALVVEFAFVAHIVEIGLWAVLFVICGEYQDFGTSYYASAVNYTTLGYGDMIMSPAWKLLGAIEAADGALMFGISTAMVFAIIQNLVLTRYRDLREDATPEAPVQGSDGSKS